MATAADSEDRLILSGANEPESFVLNRPRPAPQELSAEAKAKLKELFAEVGRTNFDELEHQVTIFSMEKIICLENMIPVMVGTKEQCWEFFHEHLWEARHRGYDFDVSLSRRVDKLDPEANYPLILRPLGLAALPARGYDHYLLEVERTGDPEGLQIELSLG